MSSLSTESDSGKMGKDGSKGVGCVQPLAVGAGQTIFIKYARDGVEKLKEYPGMFYCIVSNICVGKGRTALDLR